MLAMGASAIIHMAILVLVFSSTDTRRPAPEPPPMVISLLPRLSARQASVDMTPRSRKRSSKTAPAATAPQIIATPSLPADTAQAHADDSRLLAQAGLQRALGESVRCADPDSFKLDAVLRARCQREASEVARGGPIYDVVPADPTKAAAFARAARVDEAWRNYRSSTSTNDNPGLLTLFGNDAEPCPPGQRCWRHIP